jgi:para-nitrobenzyl esterase
MVTVDAPCGRLEGIVQGGISSFRGIPYARPPAGALRWRAPEALPPWTGVRDATRFGAACPQAPSQLDSLAGGSIGAQSEDCLTLNIWTPSLRGKRPVMVWIHGGAFAIGAGHQSVYDGTHLASRGCVVVTINYRLGTFGFLALDGIATGAEGLFDQIAALRWVKANIAAFGGGPGNVTAFGESAGAMSVAALLAAPEAQGLFHKAILQSGAGHIGHDREHAEKVSHALLAKLGTRERLREIPPAALLKAQIALLLDSRTGKLKLGGFPFQPALDTKPIDAIRAGAARGIAVLTGTTLEEWKLFTAVNPRLRLMTGAGFAQRARRLGKGDADLAAAYSEGTGFARFNAMMTDKAFMVPATRLLEAQAAYAPVYAYRFDWRSRFLGGLLGACHALELGFVFGTHNDGRNGTFFGKGLAADALSSTMMEAWTAFARTGDPGWARYDTASRETMIFGDGAPHIVSAPNEARRKAWDNVPERKLGP